METALLTKTSAGTQPPRNRQHSTALLLKPHRVGVLDKTNLHKTWVKSPSGLPTIIAPLQRPRSHKAVHGEDPQLRAKPRTESSPKQRSSWQQICPYRTTRMQEEMTTASTLHCNHSNTPNPPRQDKAFGHHATRPTSRARKHRCLCMWRAERKRHLASEITPKITRSHQIGNISPHTLKRFLVVPVSRTNNVGT